MDLPPFRLRYYPIEDGFWRHWRQDLPPIGMFRAGSIDDASHAPRVSGTIGQSTTKIGSGVGVGVANDLVLTLQSRKWKDLGTV